MAKKTGAVMLRLEPDDRRHLDMMAHQTGLKGSEIARIAVKAALNDYLSRRIVELPMRIKLEMSVANDENDRWTLNDKRPL